MPIRKLNLNSYSIVPIQCSQKGRAGTRNLEELVNYARFDEKSENVVQQMENCQFREVAETETLWKHKIDSHIPVEQMLRSVFVVKVISIRGTMCGGTSPYDGQCPVLLKEFNNSFEEMCGKKPQHFSQGHNPNYDHNLFFIQWKHMGIVSVTWLSTRVLGWILLMNTPANELASVPEKTNGKLFAYSNRQLHCLVKVLNLQCTIIDTSVNANVLVIKGSHRIGETAHDPSII